MLRVLPSYSGLSFLKSMKAVAYGLNAYLHSHGEARVLYLVIFSHGPRPTAVFLYLSAFIPKRHTYGILSTKDCTSKRYCFWACQDVSVEMPVFWVLPSCLNPIPAGTNTQPLPGFPSTSNMKGFLSALLLKIEGGNPPGLWEVVWLRFFSFPSDFLFHRQK